MEIKNEMENSNSVKDNGNHHEPHGENALDPANNYSPHNFFFDLKQNVFADDGPRFGGGNHFFS